ncbi:MULTISPECIES: dTMP kinase [Limnochorda]|uniref:dTMP kinase n=1 Tax=Limnochorda TaxID=1676651 RepID=UPI0026EA6C6D|nr:dTMP kinase [Limnochorda pilosa]
MGRGQRGRFITFEGPDGSGKTTQTRYLAQALRQRGIRVLETFEPGDTPLGRYLRQILLGPPAAGGPEAPESASWEPVPMAEMLLMAADRAQHVEQRIRPALDGGIWVICDRYIDSSLAYQGYGAGLALEQVRQVNLWATGNLWPDLTFFLDPGPGGPLTGWPSPDGPNRPDRIEDRGREHWLRVREAYLDLWRQSPGRICRIETAGKPPEAVAQEVLAHVDRWVGREAGGS